MADPVILPGAPTALDVLYDFVVAKTPGCTPGVDVTLAYNTDTPGLTRFLCEKPGRVELTSGRAVALEIPRISIQVQGDPTDYETPKVEATRLRYLIAGMGEYTSQGLKILDASPVGTLRPMGRDLHNREAIEILFDVTTEPSYT